MDYPGKVITKTQVTPTQTSASGNWTLDDQAAAIKNNNWPVALVPNPISKSLRFNSADSAYLNRTFGTPTNNKKFTYNCWVKVNAAGNSIRMLTSGITGSPVDYAMFQFSPNSINYQETASSASALNVSTVAVFRDPSAWYMVTLVVDTTLATAADRIKIYVNSVLQTLTITTQVTQNYDPVINKNTRLGGIGGLAYNGSYINFSDCYLTEVNFIDGQALTPSSFGMTNPQTGQWIPLKYSGTYGTNGFYLNFKDATSTTTLGYDYSGNANNWTTNNFSVTAGAGNDSLTDVPTPWFAYNTTGDVGGVFRGNYCTLNPLISTATLSNGNLDFSQGNTKTAASMGVISGKWYSEATCNTTANRLFAVGVAKVGDNSAFNLFASGVGYYADDGSKYVDGTNSAYGATYTAGDIIGIALNMDAGTVTFYKNNTSQGSISLPASSQGYYLLAIQAGSGSTSATWTANFGQRPFAYTPPTGFRSLCTTNLPATAIGFGLTNQGDDYFNAVLYTGNGTSQTIDTGLQPDFIWIKRRNGAAAHTLTDSVRGISKQLFSNLTDAEQTDADSGVTAISSSSITLGDNNLAVGSVNGSGSTYVAWNWKASGSTVSNTAGTITSTVSANTTAGFSIVTYTGTGSNATVGHGLGVAPRFVLTKSRSQSFGWGGYHASLGATNGIFLDETSAAFASATYWNDTAPTSSVFTIGTNSRQNQSSTTYVAYCFAAVPGYSAFGSYTGNGSADGPFVYLGFRPRYVLIKSSSNVEEWHVHDTARDTYNLAIADLYPNSSSAEVTTFNQLDILSNGFKCRSSNSGTNGSGYTFIYAAFAESPFQFANAR